MAFIPESAPAPDEHRPWVGQTWVVLMAACLIWILVWGCARGEGPKIELAPDLGALRSGQSAQLVMVGIGGQPLDLPAGVVWEVNGVPGGSPFYGQVARDGTYRAPEVSRPERFRVRLVRQMGEQKETILATGEIEVLPKESS